MLLSSTRFNELQAIYDSTSPTRYADIYDKIHSWLLLPEAIENHSNVPDTNVVAWFGAAKDANRGVGGASDFIRTYTAIQLEMRQGAPVAGINQIIHRTHPTRLLTRCFRTSAAQP
jgi:hypothetical protein